ncbi:MAG: UPF0182 family protein [Actinomycetota bacterium]
MRRTQRAAPLVLLAVFTALLFLGPALLGFLTDWLWYGELQQRRLFWGLFQTRVALGLIAGAVLATLAFGNVVLAQRNCPVTIPRRDAPEWQVATRRLARGGITGLMLFGSLALGYLGGLVASSQWDAWIRLRHAQSFGVTDPVFGKDVGFYVFQYPFYRFVAGWALGALILVTIATAAVYYVSGAVVINQTRSRVSNAARAHLSVLIGLAFLAKAVDYLLDRYGLLLNSSGLLFGGGYTDLHAQLPALNILAVLAVIAALAFFVNAYVRALVFPGIAAGLMLVASATLGGVYPGLMQRFSVQPDEQAKERPYIDRHLKATRQAYGLETIRPVEYNPSRPLTAADITKEQPTLQNARLWDYRVLSDTYHGLQRLRDYYDVTDVDIDRYTINGRYRQVMLAPRELVMERLDPRQRSWINERLQYTHGYGMVMSTVNETDPSGRPVWLIRDLPLVAAPEMEIKQPQLYYGMKPQPPVLAPSRTREFDFPMEGGNSTSAYSGSGGIPLDSAWKRYLFSAELTDWNIAISDAITPQSRVLMRRNVQERVAALAPILKFDSDPYLVVQDGGLVWVQDAYTAASTYPYSDPTLYAETKLMEARGGGLQGAEMGHFNYLRNAAKATVDAYSGEVRFYVTDETDPLIRCYRKAFPGLFRDKSEIPAALVSHLRYPEDLFAAQARKWTRYHVTDPDVFYGRSDVWAIPEERLEGGGGGGNIPMQPYYVVMRLPGETKEEFVLILPFKTRNGTTMSGWLTARCDNENYGKLRLYRFPTNSQIDAPEQVDSLIQSDPDISQQLTLLGQQGSKIRFANLLGLPGSGSLLYVKPFYLEAAQTTGRQAAIPVLKRVILAEKRGDAMKVVMRPSFREALADLVGAPVSGTPEAPPPPRSGQAPPTPPARSRPDVDRLIEEAGQAFDAAERAQRSGDWAEYGKQMQKARETLQRLRGSTR